ncbi:hypothetical protein CVT24_003242 [Panaeolus cyanescens]|uniref:Uncharacterized protein n=1 Tax=Panaeolus cyanescens TaxID=181874 RepID=A0A409VUI4_9AGAR|nr:hypothetical protein CVT24_003242 [Panaeolus cyanescens]
MDPASVLVLPVLGGQGTLIFDEKIHQQLLNLSASPSCSVLLASCFASFHSEINALSPQDLNKVDICVSEFKEPSSLFILPSERYFHNPLVTGPALLLIQVIRLLSYIEDTQDFSFPILHIFQQNVVHATGILAFSSGILSACVLSASRSLLSFISNAVEAYRLALWIGIRCQIFRFESLGVQYQEYQDQSWGLVLLGTTKSEVDQLVKDFNQACNADQVFTTAVLDSRSVTVSGHPKHLQSFKLSLPSGQAVCETRINSLYHSATRLSAVQGEVLGDVAGRKICFPTLSDLVIPVRSTFSGDLLQNSLSSKSLVELVVDMILLQPVNWDLVLQKTIESIPSCTFVQLINVGPGTSLARTLERTMFFHDLQSYDCRDLNEHQTRPITCVKQEPIAIIGMAVNMPSATNVSQLWDLLENGRNTAQEIPMHRFDFTEYTAPINSGRSMKACHGSFLDDIDGFDNRFFNISPREAKSMDPQQRILLHVAYNALEDAGYVPNSTPAFNSETFGCYIGAATYDYIQNLRNEIDVYYSTGTLGTFLSGRLSHCLRLSGPSVVVNTACSSSLVAIYQASRALLNRDCNTALAGGVNLITSPDMHIGLDRGHFLSPSGKSRPFDASADGYSRSEGCGIFVLKRLSDALAENDRVLGVIRSIEVNQSGEASSITHTHRPALESLFKRVLSFSDMDPISVNFVEAHAPGTQVGDVNEIESLRRVLSEKRSAKNPLYISSIKGNIGHLEAASGCASLAKVLLMFRHKVIPRQISLEVLNPSIAPLERDHLVIPTANLPWLPTEEGEPLRAIINNFGASGSNAAMLLEEHIPDGTSATSSTSLLEHNCYVFGLSAHASLNLEIMRSNFISWLHDTSSQHISLADIAYTSTARRQLYSHRMAIVAGTRDELIQKLKEAPIVDGSENRRVVFVFSGQGGQYRGMGRSLYSCSSVFKQSIDKCHVILTSAGFPGVRNIVMADPEHESDVLEEQEDFAAATFAIQYGLACLWMSFGIQPHAIMGHSLGEYAAFVMSECISLKDALTLIATRSRLIIEHCPKNTSGMLAVALPASELQTILNSSLRYSDVSIACYNSPQDCVVSGPLFQLRTLRDFLEDNKVCATTKLDVPYGFHSPTMNCLAGKFMTLAARVNVRPPRFQIISTLLGQVISPGDTSFLSRDYFVRHLLEPVRFEQGIKAFLTRLAASGMTWLELGPHFTISPMLRRFPELSSSIVLGSLRKRQNAMTSLSHSLASFYLSNNQMNWREVFSLYGGSSCISLPSYPFAKTRFWVPYKEHNAVGHAHGDQLGFSLLDKFVGSPSVNGTTTFEAQIKHLRKYLVGHRVSGIALCPASIYLELACAAATRATKASRSLGFIISCRRITFPKSLVWTEEGPTAVEILIDSQEKTFTIRSSTGLAETEIIHAQGEFEWVSESDTASRLSAHLPSVMDQVSAVFSPVEDQTIETFSARTLYSVIFPRVVQYSPEYQVIQSLTMLAGGMEATATVKLGSDVEKGKFVVHPIFLDGLIHVAGFVCNLHANHEYAYICSQIRSVDINTPTLDYTQAYTVFCRLSRREDDAGIMGETFAVLECPRRQVVAHVKGIQFQRVRLNALKAGLMTLSQAVPFSPRTPMASSKSNTVSPVFQKNVNLKDVESTILGLVAEASGLDVSQISPDFRLDELEPLTRLKLNLNINKAFPDYGYDVEGLNRCLTATRLVETVTASLCRPYRAFELATPLSSPETLVSPPFSISLLKKVFSSVLGLDVNSIVEDDDLASMGLDSLSTIEAIHSLQVDYNITIPSSLISSSRTIRDVYSRALEWQSTLTSPSLSHASKTGTASRTPFPVPYSRPGRVLSLDRGICLLQTAVTDRPPLILIHDGTGLAAPYSRIKNLQRRVFGLSNPRFSTSEPWSNVCQMAEFYASLVRHEVDGPVILGGWSFGGILAYEIAKALMRQSIAVLGLIVIDSPDPFSPIPMPLSVIDCALTTSLSSRGIDSATRSLCKAQFVMSSQLLMDYQPFGTQMELQDQLPKIVYLQSQEGYFASDLTEVPAWLRVRGDASTNSVTAGWQQLCQTPLVVLGIPGHHFSPFDSENIAEVSTRLEAALHHIES